MDRSVLRQKERFQLSYELPHEAYRTKVYPRQSSNGSTVVVYGHENGIRIVWYAGRHFNEKKRVSAPKVNGTSKSDPTVIDLDDDDDEPIAAKTTAEPAEFEEDEEEVDPSTPYRDVMRCIDVPLGSTATRLTIPIVSKDISQAPPGAWPAIYNTHIVIAAACSDLTIQVISIPLDPPAPEIQEVAQMDVNVVKIGGTNSHQQFISDISITQTATPLDEQETVKPQTRSQSHPKKETTETDAIQWSFLVASISCTGAGLLLVHQIPLHNNKIFSSPEVSIPIRRTYLRTSSVGAKLSFNTCAYPAERHSTLLVTLPSDSTTKVYQVFQPSHPAERRGSNATTDSVSTTRSVRTSTNDRGKFLITLLPPFTQTATESFPRRKRVLDAEWVVGGRAVIALLEDGGWGIWDLEAVGPTSSSSGVNLIRGQANISGIYGGSLTQFAIRSSIAPSTIVSKPVSSNSSAQPASGALVPMTPSTRRVRSEGLFQGSRTATDMTRSDVQQQGTIYVEERSSDRPLHDESVIISYAEENVYLPSVLAFWKGESKPIRLPALRLGGQTPRSISLLPTPSSSDAPFSAANMFDTKQSMPDFLIQTSHRMILSLKPLSSHTSSADVSTQKASGPSDQTLLVAGDLDVEGMDRMLDDMDTGATKKPMNLFTKSVGFQVDDDDDEGDSDVDMSASPTPSRTGLRITNTRNGFDGGTSPPKRRIFS